VAVAKVKLLKVLLIVEILERPVVLEKETLLYVLLPPTNSAPPVLVKLMVEVPALTVMLVPVIHQANVLPVTVTVEPFKVITFVFAVVAQNEPAVTEKLLALVLNVPDCNHIFPVAVIALPRVTVMPAPLIMTSSPKVFPPLVRVPVAVNVTAPVWLNVIPATSVMLPATLMAAVPASVPVNPVQLIDLAPVLPVAMVQVPVDRFEKNTSSALVGTDTPPAPPDVADHLEPAVPSQLAVPPTQYLSAI
jgi:hypothetical protein